MITRPASAVPVRHAGIEETRICRPVNTHAGDGSIAIPHGLRGGTRKSIPTLRQLHTTSYQSERRLRKPRPPIAHPAAPILEGRAESGGNALGHIASEQTSTLRPSTLYVCSPRIISRSQEKLGVLWFGLGSNPEWLACAILKNAGGD